MSSAIDQVLGRVSDLFQQRKGPGGQLYRPPRPSLRRLARAGFPDRAMFKRISRGGTTTRSGLRGQMDYIFNPEKAARLIDPTGRLELQDVVHPGARNAIIRDWAADWKYTPKTGNTSHLILSFPKGTPTATVEKITRNVLQEKFELGPERFKYVAAVHDDTPDHPHAHVIVNRWGSEGNLLTMRAETDLSYEAFRESMSDHALKYGVFLDPSFRFERGITDRQPTRTEQINARKEGRDPQQRPRFGADLERQQELVRWSAMAYSTLAICAYNCDNADLANYYAQVGEYLPDKEGVMFMEALSQNDVERFDKYINLIERGIREAEATLQGKDAAKRVPVELRLSDVLTQHSTLSRFSPMIEDLHKAPQADSIYMHKQGPELAAVHNQTVRDGLAQIEATYGVSATAMEARIAAGTPNFHIERLWLRDDQAQIAQAHQLDLRDQAQNATSIDYLRSAYADLRELLTKENVLERVPHLQDREIQTPSDPETYRYFEDRVADDVQRVEEYYRESGAPQEWIEANQRAIRQAVEVNSAHTADTWFQYAPNEFNDAIGKLDRDETGEFALKDEADKARVFDALVPEADRTNPAMQKEAAAGQSLSNAYPDMPHRLADNLARLVVASHPEREREGPERAGTPDALKELEARGSTQIELTDSREQVLAAIALIKAYTTERQYEQLRAGDMRGAEGLTDNPLFARQLSKEVEEYERNFNGYKPTRDEQNAHEENRDYIRNVIDRDHERDQGYER
ncbi:relaxase/mobilization nuclease domain-containing protein [Gymnodinialimonas sp. 2305UL16-5]|uniref:relaxase/mobilization nuclease domain-containing protein n=1 Tax=Gymnodinialimonas mytili TaxID=3126503 RepID=UPI0030A9A0FF